MNCFHLIVILFTLKIQISHSYLAGNPCKIFNKCVSTGGDRTMQLLLIRERLLCQNNFWNNR